MSTEISSPAPTATNDPPGGVVQYLDKVKELIPAEVSAAFLAINSAIPIDDRTTQWVYYFFVALLILCAMYMRVKSKSISQLIFITFIAFPVWAINISLARFDYFSDNTWLPASALFLVTAIAPLVPLFDKKESQK
jgi:hypothetical protein